MRQNRTGYFGLPLLPACLLTHVQGMNNQLLYFPTGFCVQPSAEYDMRQIIEPLGDTGKLIKLTVCAHNADQTNISDTAAKVV